MEARMSTFAGPPERLDEFVQGICRVAREAEQLDGYEGAYVLVGGSSGKVITMTFWRSAEAERASADEFKKIRTQVAAESGQRIQSIETYTVWLRLGAVSELH